MHEHYPEDDPEDAEHVEPLDDNDIDPYSQLPRFAAHADAAGEEPYFHFCIIEPKDFVIKCIADVYRVYEEIIACGQQNPGMVPVVHIEDLRG